VSCSRVKLAGATRRRRWSRRNPSRFPSNRARHHARNKPSKSEGGRRRGGTHHAGPEVLVDDGGRRRRRRDSVTGDGARAAAMRGHGHGSHHPRPPPRTRRRPLHARSVPGTLTTHRRRPLSGSAVVACLLCFLVQARRNRGTKTCFLSNRLGQGLKCF
jgi:hypothetical protein